VNNLFKKVDNSIDLPEREKICFNCGGILEIIETSQETWILENKEYLLTNFSLQCLQCKEKYLLRKFQDKMVSIVQNPRWEI